jgi:hypothetical protein
MKRIFFGCLVLVACSSLPEGEVDGPAEEVTKGDAVLRPKDAGHAQDVEARDSAPGRLDAAVVDASQPDDGSVLGDASQPDDGSVLVDASQPADGSVLGDGSADAGSVDGGSDGSVTSDAGAPLMDFSSCTATTIPGCAGGTRHTLRRACGDYSTKNGLCNSGPVNSFADIESSSVKPQLPAGTFDIDVYPGRVRNEDAKKFYSTGSAFENESGLVPDTANVGVTVLLQYYVGPNQMCRRTTTDLNCGCWAAGVCNGGRRVGAMYSFDVTTLAGLSKIYTSGHRQMGNTCTESGTPGYTVDGSHCSYSP